MGDTFHQLGQLFLQATPTMLLVFLLFVILERIFFRPVTAVMKKREELTVGALARARAQAAAAESKARELGMSELLVLSTQAFTYFQSKGGFAEGSPDDLPPPRREKYEQSGRNSKVLVKKLTPK